MDTKLEPKLVDVKEQVKEETESATPRDERQVQFEATITSLQRDNVKLKQELHDTALELQATVDEFMRTDSERRRLISDIDEFVRVDLERVRLIKELQAAKRIAEENSR